MHQPARSPYVSMLLLMCTAAPQRCSGWNLAQRPWSEGNCKPWPLWKGSVPAFLLQTLPWEFEHPGQHCPVQYKARAATRTWPGNVPGSAPQVELLTLASCSLCGRTSTPSSCITNTGIVNNTVKAVNKGSVLRDKATSSIFKLRPQQLRKGRWSYHFKWKEKQLGKKESTDTVHEADHESHLTCHLNPSVSKNHVNNNCNEIILTMHAWTIKHPQNLLW